MFCVMVMLKFLFSWDFAKKIKILKKNMHIKATQPELLDEAFVMLRDQAENATVSSLNF